MELSAAAEALFGQELGEPCFQRPPGSLPLAVRVTAFIGRGQDTIIFQHIHRINVQPSPECQLCGYGTMNAEHLVTYSSLEHSKNYQNSIFQEAHLYRSALHLMAQQSRVGVG
ncbi:hypothetical protein TNCT_651231 [Trichonephila clavata]|uniref:Uncharacterized protein n=1 Tax=Trichonephila clavata TaxID=2740835 RepID=A0A8X6IM33_TRICU|nr:hypothetical protein TNCT_651231 [Trichonephila clavata]